MALVLGGLGCALLSNPGSAAAEAVEVDLDYVCTDGVAPTPVNLNVTLTLQTALTAGQALDIKWGIKYKDQTRFLSPGLFEPGARVDATGVVGIGGLWSGELKSLGSQDQALLPKGDGLALPELISGAVATTKPGTIEIKPGRLFVDFTPSASDVTVNDDDPAVHYDGNWTDYNNRDTKFHDVDRDVHATETQGARVDFVFTGTGVDFISEQDSRAGEVGFSLGSQAGIPATADASKGRDGKPVVVQNQGNYTLWGMRGLPYGQHTLTVENLENKWAMVDAFRVVTEPPADPPEQFRATCEPVRKPTAIRVVVGSPAQSPSSGPSGGVSPSGDPSSDPSKSQTPGAGKSSSPPVTGNGASASPSESKLTSVIVLGSPTPTATTTITLSAPPASPQVKVTPKGGARTGEAPETSHTSAALLIGSGGAMVFGGVFSGIALLRRRAAHVNDRSRTV
ncbi:hypothetical protein [Microtetraspora sp. NBRC 16547]|uniref:hypothetical protein n=1 Tax=Microtetraspora sp. NBRC 16547 TaxID=3030993 RepID=UPI0024A1662D|nr:hypothetical protein [Microtetraspora sp. NBRC 16547]GLW96356.1 hypothetical protein Misp02_04430 [Microtetraspora sp. NBRC 16547]